MAKISAERLFKQSFPNATIERHRTNGRQTYYLVRRKRGEFMPYGDGKTRAEAWTSACRRAGLLTTKEPRK